MSLFLMDGDSTDPAMRWESIARAAFDGKRRGGPNGEADASYYDHVFTEDDNPEKVKALIIVVEALIDKVQGKQNVELNEILDSLKSEVNMTQDTAIDCIDLIINILSD